MDHNFHEQREETRRTWSDLSTKQDLPKRAVLELQFVPTEDPAHWEVFERRLAKAGYQSTRLEDGSTLQASVGPIELGFEAIWHHEVNTTQLALECGFQPDGWGFWVK